MAFRCDLCNEVFFERSSLRRHLNTKRHINAEGADTGAGISKPTFRWNCHLCDRSFARADAFKRHERTHVGYSDKCFLCSKPHRHDDLKRHEPVCVNRHLGHLRKSAKVDTSNGLVTNQTPLQFQWDPTTTDSASTKEEAFQFVRRRTNDRDTAAQDLGDLVSYAIDRDDLQMCEAVCAFASSLSISFKDMAKRSASETRKDQAPKGRFWYLKLLLRGETDVGSTFDKQTIDENFTEDGSTEDLLPGCSALYLACYQGFPEITKSLILSGANIDLVVGERTPLCLAVEGFDLDIVRILLSNGADPNGGGPLTMLLDLYSLKGFNACTAGDIATILIESGADIYVHSYSERNVLHFAMSPAHIGLLRSISTRSLPRDFLDAVGPGGNTALHFAAREGFLEGVQLLMGLGTEATDQRDRFGDTPLALASLEGHGSVVQFLLAAENRHSKQTLNTALLRAIEGEQSNSIRLLIKAGAVLTKDSDARKLHLFRRDAALGNGIIELLLDEGIRVNLLSEACIDLLLECWIENEYGDSEMRGESAPSIDLLRLQYTFFGILPWQVVGKHRVETL